MLVVEDSGNWGQLIKSLYGTRFQTQIVSPSEFESVSLEEIKLVFVQFCQPCLKSWISLFDKTAFRLENLGTALLNAPQVEIERSWCQELGFQDFVDDMDSLSLLIDRWKNDLPSPPSFGNLSDEMMRRIPFAPLDNRIQ